MSVTTCYKCGGRIAIRKMDGVAIPIHLDGACDGSYSRSTNKREQIDRIAKSLNKGTSTKKKPEGILIPNAHCPVCGDQVYYYENEHGSRVFFDDVGPPWPKHPCTDSEGSKYGYSISDNAKKWYRFEIDNLIKNPIEGGYEHEWFGNILSKEKELKYLFSITKLNFKGIIYSSCYIQKQAKGIYLLSYLKNKKTQNFEDVYLYSQYKIGEVRNDYLKKLKEKKARKEKSKKQKEAEAKKLKQKFLIKRQEKKKGKNKKGSLRRSKRKKYKCEFCKEKFKTERERDIHRVLCERGLIDKNEKTRSVNKKPTARKTIKEVPKNAFLCFYCQKSFKTKEELKKHDCK